MRHPYRPYGAGYGLNESPSEKEGKSLTRKRSRLAGETLNESPSEKEGKWRPRTAACRGCGAPQ